MSHKKKMQKRQVKIPNKYADHVMESVKKKRNDVNSNGYGSDEKELLSGNISMEAGKEDSEEAQGETGMNDTAYEKVGVMEGITGDADGYKIGVNETISPEPNLKEQSMESNVSSPSSCDFSGYKVSGSHTSKLNDHDNVGTNDGKSENPKPMSYAKVVGINEGMAENSLFYVPPSINDNGEEVVIFEDELVKEGSEKWKNTACGFLVGCSMSLPEMRYNLRRMWGRMGLGEILADANGIYYFKFKGKVEMDKVVEQSPWIVSGKPLVVQEWNPDVNIEKAEPNSIPIWIKLLGVPLEAWNIRGLSTLASRVGKPLKMDSMTTAMCHKGIGRVGYARILVEIQADKGYLDSFEVLYKDEEQQIKRKKMIKVKLIVEKLRRIMDMNHNIRNISFIARVKHGKSTLTKCLKDAAGVVVQKVAGDDISADKTELGIISNSASYSLCYEIPDKALRAFKGDRDGNEYLINLIDSPGHVDFSFEITSTLRITDGALVVIDCMEGVCNQTKSLIHQALKERNRPVLIVNRMDQLLDLKATGEDAYQHLNQIIQSVNTIMAEYPGVAGYTINPAKGTAIFSSGLHGWAFTLRQFAKLFVSKFILEESTLVKKLWGDNFFDPSTKEWTDKKTNSKSCKRGFVQFCYEPIMLVIKECMSKQKDTLWDKLTKINVNLTSKEKELTGSALIECVMQRWLPAATALLEMVICHLPSPRTAQRYRVKTLYDGPSDDQYANAIRNCDHNGPLVFYASKMIFASDKASFFAFGRVFSGKVSSGLVVRIMGPDYVPGEKKDLYVKKVERTAIWMGNKLETVEDVPCGNTVALAGLDQVITKNATLTNVKEFDARPIRALNFSVSPAVRVKVQCKVSSDLPKLVEGLKRLAKSDPMVVFTIGESGQHIISVAGEKHLEQSLEALQNVFMDGVEVIVSEPVVSFCETVSEKSSDTVKIKSPNEHNYLYMEASPLHERLVPAIGEEKIGQCDDPKVCFKILSEETRWDTKIVVDMSKGVQYLNEIEDSVVAGFQHTSKKGFLAEEKMNGICFKVCNVNLHADASLRDRAQIFETVGRAICASQLTAKPRLVEPVYHVQFLSPQSSLGPIYNILKSRRGEKIEEFPVGPGTPMLSVLASLPAAEAFGFSSEFREVTEFGGDPQCVFNHWKIIDADPFQPGTLAYKYITQIRNMKGLPEEIPLFEF